MTTCTFPICGHHGNLLTWLDDVEDPYNYGLRFSGWRCEFCFPDLFQRQPERYVPATHQSGSMTEPDELWIQLDGRPIWLPRWGAEAARQNGWRRAYVLADPEGA